MVKTITPRDPAPARAGRFFDPSSAPAREAPRLDSVGSRRHLLGLEGLPASTLDGLLDAAREWRVRWNRSREPLALLAGVEVCNAFFEDSTRTRLSFEVAERRLGATPLSFGAAGSSSSKGESLLDTLRTIVAMGVDVVVIRHRASGGAASAWGGLAGPG